MRTFITRSSSVWKSVRTTARANLIVGGGGRGVRKAPEKYSMGEWVPHSDDGDPVRGTFVRKYSPEEDQTRYSTLR